MPGHHRVLINVAGSWVLQELQRELAQSGQSYDFTQIGQLAQEAVPFQHSIDVDDQVFFAPGPMAARIRGMSQLSSGRVPQTQRTAAS